MDNNRNALNNVLNTSNRRSQIVTKNPEINMDNNAESASLYGGKMDGYGSRGMNKLRTTGKNAPSRA